jgi:CubicO group peptidase (beta-lactamase class C family)
MLTLARATAALALVVSTAAAQTAGREPFPGLDAYVTAALKTWNVPGVAVGIVRHDSVIYLKGYGVRTVGTADPVDDQTIFAIGSCTKAFTSAGLAMLVDEGKVHWDDPVRTYLPGFQVADPYVTREITLRDLVTHRTGIDRAEFLWYRSGLDRADVVRRIRFLRQQARFRAQFTYNNLMYLEAGEVLGAASGTSWDEFIQHRILDPLGMRSTTLTIRGLDRERDVSSPHRTTHGVVRAVPWDNADNIAPAGSINSNVRDMAQWVRFQLRHGKFGDKTLVSAAALDETHRPLTPMPMGPPSPDSPVMHFVAYGMGWAAHDYDGHVALEHTGGIDGFRAHVALLPDDDFGVVVLSNDETAPIYNAITDWLLDRHLKVTPLRDWSALMHAGYAKAIAQGDSEEARENAHRVTGTHPTFPLERYTGTYTDSVYGPATVQLVNGKLVFTRGELIGDLEHWNYDTFRANWRVGIADHALLTFGINAAGRVGNLTMDLAGDSITFHRRPDAADSTNRVSAGAP